jgi:hypothetical protein
MKTTICGAMIGFSILALVGRASAVDISACSAQLATGSTLDLAIQALTVVGSPSGIQKTLSGLQTKRMSAWDKLNALKCTDANEKLGDLITDVSRI